MQVPVRLGSVRLRPQKSDHSSPAGIGCWHKGNNLHRNCRAWALLAMELRRLGSSSLEVPPICFGTMLFGESTGEADAHRLLSTCLEQGVTFFDSAEMYPVPQRQDTHGMSEQILGRWMKSHRRDSLIIATKAAGPSGQMTWIRGGPASLDAANIRAAVEGSLQRLGTDYIDVYQLHWPDRYVPMFGDLDYDCSCAYQAIPLEEQLEALGQLVAAGKVRHVGLSNETPWGLMCCLHLAATQPHLPRVVSIQNAYSLTCRTFNIGLAECCHLEQVSLLAYSPLAMGLLTGKYLAGDGGPPGARLNRYKGRYAEAESRYGPKPNVHAAVEEYVGLAQELGMHPTAMALRFVLSHPLVASAVIGATTTEQLNQQLAAAAEGDLPADVMAAIDLIHQKYPNPTP